jgi:8-oxo-dGTP diphosphatase
MKVTDVDWDAWEPEMRATLMFIRRAGEVLLIRKKRGLGAGKINGPGGRMEPGETPLQCAIRETQEELLITPREIRGAGELFFHAEDMPRIHAHVFVADRFEGEPTETDEAVPLWMRIDELPYGEMWEDDRVWLPHALSDRSFRGWFTFIGEEMIDHHFEIVAD